MDRELFIAKYAIALFGSEFNEYGQRYEEIYKYELSQIFEDVKDNFDYIQHLEPSNIEMYLHTRTLLIAKSRILHNEFVNIKMPEYLDEIAFEVAKNGWLE